MSWQLYFVDCEEEGLSVIKIPILRGILWVLLMGTASGRMSANDKGYPVMGSEEIMSPKAHGTCAAPVQDNLRYGCDFKTADSICCYNRHYAEHSGYWTSKTTFLDETPFVNKTPFPNQDAS